MGIAYNPSIVTNGLVLALDAANSKSYDSNENLLTYSEQFDNGAWSKVSTTVSANATAAPNGTLTADNVTNTPNSLSYLAQVKSGLSTTTTYTVSAYVKPLTTNKVVAFEWSGAWTSFNLSNLTTTGGGGTGQITVLDNGWYRISHTVTNVTSFNVIYIGAYGTTADTVTVALWGAQLEIGSSASPYYATTASAKNRGTTLIDMTGGGNTGTLTNGPTYSSANGGSIVFDGTNDYVQITNPTTFRNQNFTVSVWVNPGTQTNTIVSMIDFDHGVNQGWVLQSEDAPTNRYYYLAWHDGTTFQPSGAFGVGTGVQVTTSTWQNIVYSKSGTSLLGYLNGVQVYTGTAGSANVNYSSNRNFRIGNLIAGAGREFIGRIANASIYNRALTAAEVAQNFNALRGRFGI